MKSLRLITIIILSLALFGCSKMDSGADSNNNTSLAPWQNLTPAARKVVAVVSRTQLLPNYLSCTGLPAANVSNGTRTEVTNALSKMAEEGNVEVISAPMAMAFVKVGAEVCNDLITYEASQETRKFFKGFNIGGNGDGATADMSATIGTLASSCWGRAPTADEVGMVINNINSTALDGRTDRGAALYVCTAILGSSAAVKF